MVQRTLLWLVLWAVIGVASVVLLILALTGHGYAGIMLGLLFFGIIGGLLFYLRQLADRASGQRGAAVVTVSASSTPDPHQQRLKQLEVLTQGQALPLELRRKVDRAIGATRLALQATAPDQGGLLTREAHDARMAAEQDLPAALEAYQRLEQSGGSFSYGEVMLSEQLQLIERRMQDIVQQQRHMQARDFAAAERYLQAKYGQGGEQ